VSEVPSVFGRVFRDCGVYVAIAADIAVYPTTVLAVLRPHIVDIADFSHLLFSEF